MKYAGIGSRETPLNILKLMTEIATAFESKGYLLRSGGAVGADSAFERGVKRAKEVYKANHATEEALTLAEEYHPNWTACSDFAKKLHARNGMILLGQDLNDPVDFVVCWTPQGKVVGGTGQALRLAQSRQIKIYNLFFPEDFTALKKFYQSLPKITK